MDFGTQDMKRTHCIISSLPLHCKALEGNLTCHHINSHVCCCFYNNYHLGNLAPWIQIRVTIQLNKALQIHLLIQLTDQTVML